MSLKIFFYILLILVNIYIYNLIIQLQEQEECLCNTGWRIENIKVISIFIIFLAIINMFIPITKWLYRIPIISTISTFTLVGIIFGNLFLIVRLGRYLNTKKCRDTCDIDWIFEYIRNFSISSIFIIAIIKSIGFFYF